MDWKIGTAFQGKGYAAEAARTAIEYLILEVGFHRIEAKCCTENTASERVMQKLGMKKEYCANAFMAKTAAGMI